ncbi:MAG: GNAT family N-acetyltransferase [Ktedonobacterales bacterium]
METIELRDVTQENWREALRLTVQPDHQRFISDYTPIVALALAKAYVRPGGAIWAPYLIYASTTMVGFVELAYEPDTLDEYWIFHFFIDRRYQGRGYGRVALLRLIERVKHEHPHCQMLQLVVHPENDLAQRLYTSAGFLPTGSERWGEPAYQLALGDA